LKARTLLILAALLLVPQLLSAGQVQVRFQTADSANLVWMIDQMSQWDARRTSSAYFQYWREKIGLDEFDLDMLDKYARIRRRIEAQATPVKGFEVPLFGTPEIGPGEKYFLAFLEIPRPDQAINSLPINDQDKKTLFEVISHFGKKIGTQGGWGQEISHLRGFQQQAMVLSSLADTSGYLTLVRDFLGVVDLPQVLTVDALWAPPGSRFVKPAIVGFHIILPLPVSSVKNDEEVVRQISVAMAECVRYMISRLPAQVRQQASSMVLTRVGFPNPTHNTLMLDATAVAIGQILFPMNRFPSLKQELVLAKNDPSLRYPYAVDLLARALASRWRASSCGRAASWPTWIPPCGSRPATSPPPRWTSRVAALCGARTSPGTTSARCSAASTSSTSRPSRPRKSSAPSRVQGTRCSCW
jgi:hypothetical protein